LTEYQARYVLDGSRFKIWLAARQVGKSFGTAFEVVLDGAKTGQDWIILSAGERQAKDFMRKVGAIAQTVCGAVRKWQETLDVSEWRKDEVVQVEVVELPNGARIRGLPANPATARGFSANVVLDEFAFHEKPGEIWRAVFPIISNPMRGQLKLRVLSTPAGKNNKFFELWDQDEGATKWSRHRTTIHDAKAHGLEIDIESLREALDDPDGWAQEYECEFLEAATQLFPFELIESVTSDLCTTESVLPVYPGLMRYGGGDVGRHRDLSVSWLLKDDTNKDGPLITEEVVPMERMPFEAQQKIFGERILLCSRFAIDASGLGEETAERLQTKYGEGRVQSVKFTHEKKGELLVGLKDAMQKKRVLIPRDEKIRKSLASIQKLVTPGGTVRYAAAHTADGHADEAMALALAVWAARSPTGAISATQARQIKSPKPLFQAPRYRF